MNLHGYYFDIEPVSKPRMTSSDRWKKRRITDKYWTYKMLLKFQAKRMGLNELPISIQNIVFHIPMPKSMSEKEKKINENQLHTSRPDLDNLLKGLQDALCKEDSHIAEIKNLKKIWSRKGGITIEINQ